MLPNIYSWLEQEPGPKMIREGLKIYGIKEAPGDADNPLILSWAKELGITDYHHDAVPWCGLAMAIVAHRAGKKVVKSPLWALNWVQFGEKVTDGPKLGDVMVYKRPGGGHVGLYVGEDDNAYHNMGGNQSNIYNIERISKYRLYAIRRPLYTVAPPNIRRIFLTEEGKISENEK